MCTVDTCDTGVLGPRTPRGRLEGEVARDEDAEQTPSSEGVGVRERRRLVELGALSEASELDRPCFLRSGGSAREGQA